MWHKTFSRREWLRVGGLTTVGLSLPQLLAYRAHAENRSHTFGRAKSCILCFMWGGQSHLDLYDLKPEAPVEIRGEFQPIATSVPGIHFGELIPRIASQLHRMALVRSVTHPDSTHTIAMHYMLTGQRHRRPATNPMNAPDDFPCYGAVMQKLRPSATPLPSAVTLSAPAVEVPLGHIFPGFYAGFLGSGFDPMFIPEDPSAPNFEPIRQVDAVAPERMRKRVHLLEQLDQFAARASHELPIQQAAKFHEKALQLVRSTEARRAFKLDDEPTRVREQFGPSPFGQSCLLARRLIEAGVRLVTVNWARTYQPGSADLWDTHQRQFPQMREQLCPPFDVALPALLDDLEERGLLDETLVVVMSEFGRTPKINAAGGRDHWPGCNSILFAGAGIPGGVVIGASDSMAMYPSADPVTPEDVAATIYHRLGIAPDAQVVDHAGRPMPICTGRPLFV